MNIRLATGIFVVTTALLSPLAVVAADDRDADRSHPMTFVKDSAITVKVKAMLANEKMASLGHIQVDTDANGAVVLSGNVRSREAADRAVSITRGVEGVTSVANHLHIKKDD